MKYYFFPIDCEGSVIFFFPFPLKGVFITCKFFLFCFANLPKESGFFCGHKIIGYPTLDLSFSCLYFWLSFFFLICFLVFISFSFIFVCLFVLFYFLISSLPSFPLIIFLFLLFFSFFFFLFHIFFSCHIFCFCLFFSCFFFSRDFYPPF